MRMSANNPLMYHTRGVNARGNIFSQRAVYNTNTPDCNSIHVNVLDLQVTSQTSNHVSILRHILVVSCIEGPNVKSLAQL
jgi:hypothetical protein